MKELKWIESAGGPLIIVSDNIFKLWSGTYKRNSYLLGIYEEADNFLDETESDYGLACSVDNYLGLVDIKNESVLVLGDEPMRTTVFFTLTDETVIARWVYGNDDSENLLYNLDLSRIDDWEFGLTINFNSSNQYLFDSGCAGKDLDYQNGTNDFLLLKLVSGQYKIFTTTCEPNKDTKFFLHKFEKAN